MKRKTTFLKTLLVAVGLLTGMNAWAETYTGTVDFAAKSRSTYADGTFTTDSNAGNGYALAVADLSGLTNITSASSVTIEFDVVISGRLIMGIGDKNVRGTNANGSSKTSYNTDGIIMRYATTEDYYVRVNGGSNISNTMGVSTHVTFTLDRVNGKYSYTIKDATQSHTLASATNVSTSVSNATIVEAYSWKNSQSNAISAVSYSYEYTATKFNYTVNAVDGSGNVLQEINSGTSEEAVSVYYPFAINKDGVWYTTAASTYLAEVTSIKPTANITYTANSTIKAYLEGESVVSYGSANANLSNGFYGYVAGGNKASLGTLPLGVYTFYGKLQGNGNRGLYLRNLGNSANASNTIVNLNINRYSAAGIYSESFTLTSATEVGVSGFTTDKSSTNQSADFDYVYIVRDELASAILECKTYDTSTEFATAIDAETFTTAAEVYAFNTTYHITNGTLTDGVRDVTGVIRNAAINDAVATDWEGASTYSGQQYTGATDEYFIDKYQANMWATQTVYGLPAGTYFVKVATRANTDTYSHVYVSNGTEDIGRVQGNHEGNTGGTLGNGWSWTEVPFTLTATTDVILGFYVAGITAGWASCDDWHLYRVETVPATMGANGYTTFASAYNLDLDNLPDGLTAYTASLAGTKLSFTEKSDAAVAAGTGLLLMGDAGQSYDIPVAATGSAVAGNALTGVTTATELQSNAESNYIFVMKKAETASDALTFLPLSTSAAVTVPAGKAYVSVPASVFTSGAKALTVSFGDVTGIESLKAEKVANGQWFNLAGQRVAQPTKGLYIQNGKKVIVK